MFGKDKEPDPLRGAYDKALLKLNEQTVGSQEYVKSLEAVIKLHGMLEKSSRERANWNTILTVGANLTGILLIIRHEHVNVIASKAMNQVIKLRT